MCFTIALDAVCCAGSALCSAACCCCKGICGTTFKEQIKLAYIILNVIAMLFTVFCLYWIQEMFENYITWFGCPQESGGSSLCLGVSAVYRMSFVLATMYAFLLVCMLFRGEVARLANEGFWALKFLYIAGFFVGCLYISNHFFIWYIDFARVISGLYLIFQIVMLIDVFYLWGQAWITNYEAGNEFMSVLLIATSILLYGGAFTLNIFNFIWFDGCPENVFMNVFTIIIMIVITGVQLLGWNPQGSLISSGSMSIYIVYQSFSAQASSPNASCNQLLHSSPVMSTEICFGFLMSIIALLYLTFAVKENSSNMLKVGSGGDMAAGFLQSKEEKNADRQVDAMKAQQNIDDDDENQISMQNQQQNQNLNHEQKVAEARALIKQEELAPYQSNQYINFHIIMFITVVYMAMMITNWGAPSIESKTTDAFQPSWMSYWIKMVTSWIAALIYIWTLVAPRIFPDRDFS